MTNRPTPVGAVDEELVHRLRETSHDPACPFNLNCYCDDQGSHDRISDPDKQQAATLIGQLLNRVERLEDALRHYDCGAKCSYLKGKFLMPDGRCPREYEGGCGKVARAALTGEHNG